ncbi:MAG: S9 family peptidase [Pirellulales bacterium]|nr:S9 family peptidase [Pirellulales bacterium]
MKSQWLAAFCLVLVAATRGAAQETIDPRRPAAIRTTGVPVVPAELFERLRQYQNVRSAGFQGWSPDGNGMLIATRFGNSAQLHRVYEPGGRREQVTFFDEPVSGRFIPKSPSGELLLSMSAGGDENYQIYYLNRQSGRATMLTDGKSRNELGPVRHDGDRMIVHSNRRNGRDTDIYLASTREPDEHELLMETSGEYWVATDFSPEGDRLAMIHYVSINESYPALYHIATRKLEKLKIPGEGKVSFGALAFTPDGKSVYTTSDARSEYQELARVDLATGQYTWLTSDTRWDVSDVEVDDRNGLVAYAFNENGASKLFLLEGDKSRPIELPLGVIANLEFSADGERLGFTLARPDAPADAYSVDVKSSKLTRWTFSEVGGLDPAGFATPEMIRFPSFDGREIPAYFYRPKPRDGRDKAPVVINIHGGPEAQSRPIFSGPTQYLVNELGFAVIYPNVRGSAGYGKTYLQLDNAEHREDSVKDIGALLDWIQRQPELDSTRVAVTGGSYGGYMVLSSLVNFGERIKAGVDIVGIANFITFLERTSPYRQDLRRAEYGDERKPEMRAYFEKINPTNRVSEIRSALLVAHGINDPRVPFFEAEQIAEKVRAAGRDVWTLYADNEGHGFGKKDNRDYLTAVEVLFLEAHLGTP